jgi:hypothetical protein
MSLDEAETVFVRKPDTIDSKLMSQLAGSYEAPSGIKVQVVLAADSKLSLIAPGQPVIPLIQLKGLTFRTPQFSDSTFEFLVQNGQVMGLKQKRPGGEFTFPKR